MVTMLRTTTEPSQTNDMANEKPGRVKQQTKSLRMHLEYQWKTILVRDLYLGIYL